MRSRILATLLHYANADPPFYRERFYALKDRLLQKYASRAGQDVQHIKDRCWGYMADQECGGPTCSKCGGTGVYSEFFVLLDRYKWHGYIFHRPVSRVTKSVPGWPTIVGRIQHKRSGRANAEACLWLYLLTGEWRLFARALRSSATCGRHAWPLLNLQRVVFHIAINLRRQRCWCGRSFMTWGSGWQICNACREARTADTEELPF